MFGRRRQDDEDPFAALKQGGTYTSAPSTTVPGIPGSADVSAPVSQATPATSTRVAGARAQATRPQATRARTAAQHPARRVRFARRLFLVRLLIPLVAVLIVVAAAGHVSSNGGGSGNQPILGSVPSPGVGAGAAGGAGTATGHRTVTGSGSGSSQSAPAGPTSYLTRANLSAGLARVLTMAPGSKLLLLRIDSSSLDATVQSPHQQPKNIDFGPYGTVVTGAGSPGSRAIAFSSIKAAVVPRLIKQLRTQFHVPAKRISYMVAFWFPGLPPSWGVYLANGTNYLASLSGAGLRFDS